MYDQLDPKRMMTDSAYHRISVHKNEVPSYTDKTVIRKPRAEIPTKRVKRPASLEHLTPPDLRPLPVLRSRSKESPRAPMPLPRSEYSPVRRYGDAMWRMFDPDVSVSPPTMAKSGRLIVRNCEGFPMEYLKKFLESKEECGGGELEFITTGRSGKEVIIKYKHQSGNM